MPIVRALAACLAVWGCACAAAGTSILEAVHQLSAVSSDPAYWNQIVPSNDRQRLELIADCTPEEIDRLLQSDDPREVGAGIFALSAQGNVRQLLELKALLDDARVTIPRPVPVSRGYKVREQSVGALLGGAICTWTGLPGLDAEGEMLRALHERYPDPEALITPWLVRLRLVQSDAAAREAVIEQVEALPESLRWAVATMAWNNGKYLTEDEARRILAGLSDETKRAIVERRPMQVRDPALPDREVRNRQMMIAEALLDDSKRGRMEAFLQQKHSEPTLPDFEDDPPEPAKTAPAPTPQPAPPEAEPES